MVAHERIKGTKLHPANTQLFVRVALKAADVSADKRYSIELKFQNSYKPNNNGLIGWRWYQLVGSQTQQSNELSSSHQTCSYLPCVRTLHFEKYKSKGRNVS